MAEELPKNGRSDHDLLIEMATKLDRVITDLKSFDDKSTKTNAELQASKLDKDEFKNWDRSFCRDYERDMGELKKMISDNVRDHEKRIRRLEQWGFIAIGAMTLLQILMSLAK